SDNPLRKIFFFTSLAFYQPEIPDTQIFIMSRQSAIIWRRQSHNHRPPRAAFDSCGENDVQAVFLCA
ncbi:hypothetical protein OLN12_31515, partial [Pseudomonas aeruginosa]|uniref:hypothetical protein n=1 Tax=Pseudomonas aeruginosa TaxID=287 RepID=UPI00249681DF